MGGEPVALQRASWDTLAGTSKLNSDNTWTITGSTLLNSSMAAWCTLVYLQKYPSHHILMITSNLVWLWKHGACQILDLVWFWSMVSQSRESGIAFQGTAIQHILSFSFAEISFTPSTLFERFMERILHGTKLDENAIVLVASRPSVSFPLRTK